MRSQARAGDLDAARARRVALVLVAFAALAYAAPRIPLVSVPLERDEGEYAYVAQRLLEGEVPYRDAFDQKPPAVFLVYAAAIALLGPSVEAIRLFLYAWTALAAWLLYRLVRRLADPLAAGFALLAFAVTSVSPELAATAANTELFMLLPLVGSLSLLLRALESSRVRHWAGCGALLALAFWFKPVAATQALFSALVALVVLRGRAAPQRELARALLGLGLGAALLSAPLLGYFAARGAWAPFVDAVFAHNLAYASRLTLPEGWQNLRTALRGQAPAFAGLWLLAAAALVAPPLAGRRTRWLLAGWLIASLAGASLGLYFRRHYFVQCLPALCALAGVAAGAVGRRLLAGERALPAWLAIAALGAVCVAPPLVAGRDVFTEGDPDVISRRIYGFNPFPETRVIGELIREASEPGDSIYVVGSEPQIFFYARRRSATRYIIFYPLTADYPDARERQREALAEVAAARPLYVVWVKVPTSTLIGEKTPQVVFRKSARLLRREYRLESIAWIDAAAAASTPGGVEALERSGFAFAHGDEAQRVLASGLSNPDRYLWLAVYRRDR